MPVSVRITPVESTLVAIRSSAEHLRPVQAFAMSVAASMPTASKPAPNHSEASTNNGYCFAKCLPQSRMAGKRWDEVGSSNQWSCAAASWDVMRVMPGKPRCRGIVSHACLPCAAAGLRKRTGRPGHQALDNQRRKARCGACAQIVIGGRGGIRTHGTLAGTPVFKTGALNHSATLPAQEFQSLSLRRCGTQ
jgi:hypothetical protein